MSRRPAVVRATTHAMDVADDLPRMRRTTLTGSAPTLVNFPQSTVGAKAELSFAQERGPPFTDPSSGRFKIFAVTADGYACMNDLVLVLDAAAGCIAFCAIAPLWAVSGLVRSKRLKWAWQSLAAIVVGCILLDIVHATSSYGLPSRVADLAGGGIFLLGASFVYVVALLTKRTAEHVLRVEELAQAAYIDALTGIGNLRRFSETLSSAIIDATMRNVPLSVITADIDHFKRVNDTFGHAVGDEVLNQVAQALVASVRASDTVCRVGGEEFAVVVPGLPQDLGAVLAERIRKAVATLRLEVGVEHPLRATVSVGFACLTGSESSSELLGRADEALYAAKRSGRDCVRLAA